GAKKSKAGGPRGWDRDVHRAGDWPPAFGPFLQAVTTGLEKPMAFEKNRQSAATVAVARCLQQQRFPPMTFSTGRLAEFRCSSTEPRRAVESPLVHAVRAFQVPFCAEDF